MYRYSLMQPRKQPRKRATASLIVPQVPTVIVRTSIPGMDDFHNPPADIQAESYDLAADLDEDNFQVEHSLIPAVLKPDSALFTGERDLWGETWMVKEKNKRIYNAISQFDPDAKEQDCDPYAGVSLAPYCSWCCFLFVTYHCLPTRLLSQRFPMTLFQQKLELKMTWSTSVLPKLVIQCFRRMSWLQVRKSQLCLMSLCLTPRTTGEGWKTSKKWWRPLGCHALKMSS